MRKIHLLFAFMFICASLNAQFKLTHTGFVDSQNLGKNYVVINFDSLSQKKLYTEVLKFITTSFKSPKDVINEVENEMITIRGIQPKKIGAGMRVGKSYMYVYDLDYNITINFKNGKIKIDAPSFECYGLNDGKKISLVLQGGNSGLGGEFKKALFDKKGDPKEGKIISQLENFFNAFILMLEEYINNTSNQDW